MRKSNYITAALALCLSSSAVLAQSGQSQDNSTQLAIRQAMETYQRGLDALSSPAPSGEQPTAATSGLRELTLESAVAMALEKNLDIAVARLEPESVDYQIAGVRNSYKPVLFSTLGQRDQYQLNTSQLNGGEKVNNGTSTYNLGMSKTLAHYGGQFSFNFNNARLNTSNSFATFNPSFTTSLNAQFAQPLIRGFKIDNTRQQLLVSLINRDISEESARATITQTLANVRNAYWDLVFTRSAVEVALRAQELADKLVEDNQARVEVGTLAPLDIVQAQAEAATRRQNLAVAEAASQTAELALKRYLVAGTDDPMWRQEIRPVDLPLLQPAPADIESAIRAALANRTDIQTARKNLDSNDVNMRFFKNQSMPAVDLNVSYGAQGLGGTQFIRTGTGIGSSITGTVPGGYLDALSLLSARDYPQWNMAVTMSYPLGGSTADAQYARTRVQRSQAVLRLRSLEVAVAAEVANAALTVQSNLKRVEAATAARELAQKRLEAEQSRFDVGMSTNFFVVQAQRDLRDAENTELRALADYRKSLVNFERAQQAPGGGGGINIGAASTTGAVGGGGGS